MPRSRTPSTSTASRSCRRTSWCSRVHPWWCRARSGTPRPPRRSLIACASRGGQDEATRVREGHRRGGRARGAAVAEPLLGGRARAGRRCTEPGRDGAREPQGLRGAARARNRSRAPHALGGVERALAPGRDRRPPRAAPPARRGDRPVLRGRPRAAVLGPDAFANPEVPRRQPRRPLLLHQAARRPPLPDPRQHRGRRLHLLHVSGRRDECRRRHHRRAQQHAVRRRARRELRAHDRAGRERPQRGAPRRQDRLDHHAPLLRERDLRAVRSEREDPARDRAARSGRAAAAALRRRERAPHPRRRALLPREHARHAAARAEDAARMGVDGAEPARHARAPGRPRRRVGLARRRQRLQHGPLRAGKRPGAGDDRAPAEVHVRERRALEPLDGELRIPRPAHLAESQADAPRARRELPHRDRRARSRHPELARDRRPAQRHDLLALPAAARGPRAAARSADGAGGRGEGVVQAARSVRELVLVGGGHAHVQVFRRLAMRPLDGVRVTVVLDRPEAVYSGMVPGFVAGDYAARELTIDVVPLARRAGACVVLAAACGVDPKAKTIALAGRPALPYDVASLDVGATVRGLELPGVAEYALATRPIHDLVERLEAALARARARRGSAPLRLVVVGGGAAGVELAFTLEARLRRDGAPTHVTLVGDVEELLPGASRALARAAGREIRRRGFGLRLGTRVSGVDADGVRFERRGAEGAEPADLVVWATGAAPLALLAGIDSPKDDAGFVRVRDTFQVVGADDLFAAGDCAGLDAHPWVPKAGVYAVRAGPFLDANLRARLAGGPLRRYRPQRDFLALLNLGDRRALGGKWGLAASGHAVWRLKD